MTLHDRRIYYRGGYRYQLAAEAVFSTTITPAVGIVSPFLRLTTDGHLTIKAGYAWDGPSGPTFDTPNFMRGSLVHDAFYQLMREGFLAPATWRKPADKLLRAMCREDGMSWLRAQWVYHAVRWGAGYAADPATKNPVICAPREATTCDE